MFSSEGKFSTWCMYLEAVQDVDRVRALGTGPGADWGRG